MNATVRPGAIHGKVTVPGSKSHTIRALVIAALADGESTVRAPLDSTDTKSCVAALRELGVEITEHRESGSIVSYTVNGTGGTLRKPVGPLDCGNSGTTFYILLSVAALSGFETTLTGDEQLRRRSAEQLLVALEELGCTVDRHGNAGSPPVSITGPLTGGSTRMECPTSQYLTSLLLAAPLASTDTRLEIPLLNERPYVEMTLAWLESQHIRISRDGWSRFTVPGRQRYHGFDRAIPGDFSAATFFAAAAALGGEPVEIGPLDPEDSQGDKEAISALARFGCRVSYSHGSVTVSRTGPLGRASLDLNTMPDALPAMAVLGTAMEELRLVNVAHARAKETDRIAVMAAELRKLGADVDEREDGLEVRRSALTGGTVESHGDHRVAMALAVAGLAASGPVTITGAECAAITFPGFFDQLTQASARVELA